MLLHLPVMNAELAAAPAIPDDSLLQLCKAAADPLRLQILRVLSRDAFSVQELCQILDIRQSGMSHHLKILSQGGLITKRREGNSLFYRRRYQAVAPELAALQQNLLAAAERLQLDEAQQQRWQQVVDERCERSRAFFTEHASQFGEQQELMVGFGVYGQSSAELLLNSQPDGGQLAIEIGPGNGAFLCELAPRYQRVIALDNSAEMLNKARQTAEEQALDNIEFVLGDSRQRELGSESADCVIANMVLHHLPSPADMFVDASRMLRPGGLFCVTELCPHDQNWAREACGDQWLGIDPDELTEWAAACSLEDGPSVYLAQLNGFRVQVRQFIKPE